MKKLAALRIAVLRIAVLGIAALGATLLVLGTAPAASAYPEVTCNVTVNRQVLNPGDTFTATGQAHASGGASADSTQWTFTWNGVTKQRTGALVHASFTAPQVSHTRKITLTARGDTPRGPCIHHLDITVLGPSVAGPHGGGGVLPSTGGPAFWLLVAALVLLLVGGGVVVKARRHS